MIIIIIGVRVKIEDSQAQLLTHYTRHFDNFQCHDNNVAFMQQVHSKTTQILSVLLMV